MSICKAFPSHSLQKLLKRKSINRCKEKHARRQQRVTTPRIFVAHSSKDHNFCLRLVNDLRRVLGDNSAVWYDAQGGLQVGDIWWHKIMQELKARSIFIVVLSPDAIESKWVNSEIDLAWKQMHSSTGKLIIPILYRACKIRDDLDLLQSVSFLPPKTYAQAFKELILALELLTEVDVRKEPGLLD